MFRLFFGECNRLYRAPRFKCHDMIKDFLFDVFWCGGVSANKEVPVNFVIDALEERSNMFHTL